jgi:hypothetical protein
MTQMVGRPIIAGAADGFERHQGQRAFPIIIADVKAEQDLGAVRPAAGSRA